MPGKNKISKSKCPEQDLKAKRKGKSQKRDLKTKRMGQSEKHDLKTKRRGQSEKRDLGAKEKGQSEKRCFRTGPLLLSLFCLIIASAAVIIVVVMLLKSNKSTLGVSSAYASDVTETAETTLEAWRAEQAQLEQSLLEQNSSRLARYEKKARALLAEMTLQEKICQMFIVTQEQLTGYGTVTQSGSATKSAIEAYPVGGIIYFAQNIVSRDQVTEMIRGVQSFSEIGLFIGVDEEGGTVSRIAKNSAMSTTSFPSMQDIGDTGDSEKAYEVGETIGTEIGELGFNLDFAPVADVFSNPANTVIGSRSFSSDPQVAADMVAACVEGFEDSGTLCTLKHFPGHGDTSEDSHYESAKTTKTLEELEACEFLPFASGIESGAPFVMVGHISTPNAAEEDVPATLSKEIITGILREQLGFEGLVITDSMQMQAITDHYSSARAAVKAVQAGVDIILMPADLKSAVAGLESAVESGELTEERIDESVLRILETKLAYKIAE